MSYDTPHLFKQRRITWRTYDNGQRERPLWHRFEVKGGERLCDVCTANANGAVHVMTRTKSNPLCVATANTHSALRGRK